MSLEPEVLRAQLARLPYPEDALEALLAAMSSAPPGRGLRAAYAMPGQSVMAAQPEAIAARYAELVAPLPPHAPFTFMPLSELVLRLVMAASLLHPELELLAGTNEAMALHVAAMRHHGTLHAMLEAGQGIFEYLELVTGSAEHFYNFGARSHRHINARLMILHFEDYPVALSRYWVVGLNEGLLRIFGTDGTVRFVPLATEHAFELHVLLAPP